MTCGYCEKEKEEVEAVTFYTPSSEGWHFITMQICDDCNDDATYLCESCGKRVDGDYACLCRTREY